MLEAEPKQTILQRAKGRVNKAFERDRRAEGRIEAVSRALWPWRERRLVDLVCVLVIIDYITTYVVLEFSGKAGIGEGGLMAAWALRIGGMGWLFLVDLGAVVLLTLAAFAARHLYSRFGFKGFARASFVALLLPYAVAALAAAVNNVVITLL